jgi:hypothetical protein
MHKFHESRGAEHIEMERTDRLHGYDETPPGVIQIAPRMLRPSLRHRSRNNLQIMLNLHERYVSLQVGQTFQPASRLSAAASIIQFARLLS